jgi:hypothetical protein
MNPGQVMKIGDEADLLDSLLRSPHLQQPPRPDSEAVERLGEVGRFFSFSRSSSPSPSPSPHSFILAPALIPSYPEGYPEGKASLREMSRQHFFNKPGPASPFRQSRQDLAGEACHVPASAENHDILSTALTKCRLSASQRQHLFADCKVSGIFIILLNSFDLALCSRSFSLRSKANSFYRSVIWSD